MFNRLIILAALFLASEKVNSSQLSIYLMQFSDALPVQWWLVNCQTYNQHEASGVHHKCFFAPWECDDTIKVQFKDEVNQDFSLLIFNQDEEQIDSIDLEEVSPGYYQLDVIPSQNSPGFCEEKIQFKIQSNAGFQGFALPDLDEFLNSGGSGDPWTLGAAPSINISFIGTSSEILYVDFPFVVGIEYRISVNFTSGAGLAGLFTVRAMDSSNTTIFSESTSGVSSGPNVSDELVFVATSATTRLGISLNLGAASTTITINSLTATRQVGIDTIVAKTDWLDLRIEHPNTILITYSNHRNFAGLNYENTSPDNDFTIRVPAVFFHQRFPEEDEVMELSTSLQTLNGTLRKQRQLDTDYLPYYFHEKMKLILKHQNVTILDRQWVKQEGYEIVEGDRRWPIKKAKCWLSEKEFVHRNIL